MSKNYTLKALAILITANSSSSLAESVANETLNNEANLDVITVTAEQPNSYNVATASSAAGISLTPKHTPKLVTTMTQAIISDKELNSVANIIDDMPGVHLDQQDGSSTNFFSRGFAIDHYQVDGMDVDFRGGEPTGNIQESSAIYEKVEVVHGANGLMTGAGEPSASINFIRKQADTIQPKGSISIYAQQVGRIGTTLDVSSKLNNSGTLRGRLIADGETGNTFLDREKKQRQVVYATLAADVSDKTTLEIGARQRTHKKRDGMSGAIPAYYADGTETNWDMSKSTGVDWQDWNTKAKEYNANLTHQLSDNWALKIQGNKLDSDSESKSMFINGYAYKDPQKKLNYSASKNERESSQDNIGAQLSGDFNLFGENHQAMVGLQYSKYNLKSYSFPALQKSDAKDLANWDGSLKEPKWADKRQLNYNTSMTEKAINASAKFQLTDKWGALIGGRLTNYDVVHEHTMHFSPSFSFTNEATSEYHSEFTPFAGLTYDVTDNTTAFVSYTDIFQPQFLLDKHGELLDPIIGENIEAGVKFSNEDDTLLTQLSVFSIKQDNLAKRDIGQVVPNTNDWAFIGSEGTTSKGFELELSGDIAPNWRMHASYSYSKVRDKEGERFNPEQPERLFKAFSTYDVNSVPGLTIGGGVKWFGSRSTEYNNGKNKDTLPSYAVVDMMTKYQANKNLSYQLNVNNIFDKKYRKSQHATNYINGEPRNVMGRVTYSF